MFQNKDMAFFRRSKNKKFIVVFALLIVIGVGGYFLFNNLKKVSAEWFDQNWYYRQAINISNSAGSNQTDYQVSITLNTSALVTAGKLQSNCNDIRVTDNNGKLLPYWIETGASACNTTTTAIWTKVPSIPTSGQTVYIYYGNPNAVSAQNGNNVFIFFSDFSSITDWTSNSYTGGAITATGGEAKIREYQHYHANIRKQFSGSLQNTIIEGLIRYDNTETAIGESWFPRITAYVSPSVDVGVGAVQYSVGTLPTNRLRYNVNNSDTDVTATNYAAGDRAVIKLAFSTTQYTVATRLQSSSSWDGTTTNSYTISNLDNAYIVLGKKPDNIDYSSAGSIGTHYWDWVRVRKYAATEPTNSAASEEKSPAPVAWWKFDEGQGTSANDSTSNNNVGTLSGATKPTWQTGDMCVTGKCLKFDGSTSYVNAQNGASLNLGTGDFTISFWMYYQGTTAINNVNWAVSKAASSASAPGFAVGITTYSGDGTNFKLLSSITNGAWGTGNLEVGSYVKPDKWYYVVFIRQGTTLMHYMNGAADGTRTGVTVVDVGTANPFTIGGIAGGGFAGRIDDVKVYSYARSAAQIKTDYLARGTVSGTTARVGVESSWMTNGLVGYWKMDDNVSGDAKTLVDSSGSGLSATTHYGANTTGMDCTAVGKFGTGCNFDGVDDYASVADNAILKQPSNAITLSAWIYAPTPTSNYQMIIDKQPSTGSYGYTLRLDSTSGKILFRVSGTSNTDLLGNTVLSASTWYHVLGVYDGNTSKIYVNGVLDGSQANSGTIVYDTSDLGIGRRGNQAAYYFNGKIDEARIYSRALSPQEVVNLYNFAPGPVGWWKMDDKVSGDAQTLVDSSTYGSNATTHYGANASGMNCKIIGRYGGGCLFDGVDDYADAGNPAILQNAVNELTVSYWVYINAYPSSNYAYMISKGYGVTSGHSWTAGLATGGTGYFFVRKGDNSGYDCAGTGAGCSTGWPNIPLKTWTHMAHVFKGGNYINNYINGVLVGSEPISFSSIYNSSDNVQFGGGNVNFNGSIDDVRIYNYARTQKQILEDMNVGHPSVGSPVGSYAGYWKFDEGHDNTINDMSVNANTGLNYGATWVNSGKFGKAMNFDGSTSYVDVNNGSSLNSAQRSISAWIRVNTVQLSDIVDAGCSGFTIYIDSSQKLSTTLQCVGGANAQTDITPALGQWYHIVGTYDGSQVKTYINGVLKATKAATSALANSTSTFIGKGADGYFKGIIDEVKIFPFALTADDVKTEYNRGSAMMLGSAPGLNTDGLILNLDSTNPISYPGYGTTWYDISGNKNDFTITGGPQFDAGQGFGSFSSGKLITRASFPQNLKTSQGGSGLTVLIWAKSTGLSSYSKLIGNNDSDNYIDLYQNPSGYWHQDGSGETLYVDGVQVTNDSYTMQNAGWHLWGATNLNSGVTTNPVGALTIGNEPNGTSFPWLGKIAVVRLYNRVLAPGDMKQIYDQEAGKFGLSNTGPVGEWKFDEKVSGNAQTVYDTSGNGNNGTTYWGANASGMNCKVPGKYGSACQFDGVDDYIDIPNNASLQMTTFTAEFWVMLTRTANYEYLVSKGAAGTNNGWDIQKNTGSSNIELLVSNSGGYWEGSTVGLSLNTLTHIAVVYDNAAGTAKIYKNGVLGNSASSIPSMTGNTARNFTIGNHYDHSSYPFNGILDNVQIYNYVRTPAQIAMDYNNGKPIGWWKMDECQGTTINDISGNGNNGTVTIGGTAPQTQAGTCSDGLTSSAWYNGRVGKYNSAMSFDGADDYATVPNTSLWNFGTNDFSIDYWFKTSSGSREHALNFGSTGSSNNISFDFNDSGYGVWVYWMSNGTPNIRTTKAYNDGNWHHLVFLRSGTNAKLYIDGVYIGGVVDSTSVSISGSLYIGGGVGGWWWNGLIDEVKIYNYALTPGQIQLEYNQGAAVRFGPVTGKP